MMKQEYSCDICRDPKKPHELHGVHFLDYRKFDIRDARSTDGIHICFGCMDQLAAQAGPAVQRRQPQPGGEK
jgi:hypothetical protein